MKKPWWLLLLCSCFVILILAVSESKSPKLDASIFLLKDATNADFDLSSPRTIVALFLAAIGASISSAGGIGGGGLFVPMFNLLLRFNTRTAAVLSNFMIFGGMVANMIWSSFQRDPLDAKRPLIDFDAALLMQPNMLLGISIGVMCNLMFPGWLITLLLTITLGFVTFRSCKCGFRLWKDESELVSLNKTFEDEKNLEESLLGSGKGVEESVPDEEQGEDKGVSCCVGLPFLKFLALLLVWLFFFAVQLFRGSKTSEGYFHLRACGTGYWIVTASQLPFTFIFTAWLVWRAHKEAATNTKCSTLHAKAHFTLPVMAFLAGVLGGLLGIGGGMLISPILLEIGMPPQVTAATSAFMVFFSSSLSVVQYWLMGRIPLEYAVWFSSICFVFSLVGLLIVQRAVRRYGRASIIVFLVASVMGLSAALLVGFGGMDVWNQYKSGDYMGFRSAC